MSESNTNAIRVELTEINDPAPISAPFQSFLQFAAEVSMQLDALESEYGYLSARQSLRATLVR